MFFPSLDDIGKLLITVFSDGFLSMQHNGVGWQENKEWVGAVAAAGQRSPDFWQHFVQVFD